MKLIRDIYNSIVERFEAIMELIWAEEYILITANKHTDFSADDTHAPIVYNYLNNTDREIFYKFAHDHIEKTLMPNTGKFECILDYELSSATKIKRGDIVNINSGVINLNINSTQVKFNISTAELNSHFVWLSK